MAEGKETTQKEPLLAEFREVPEGYVSVFVQIPKEELVECAQNGLRVEDNPMANRQPTLEAIFEQERIKAGKGTSRTTCLFAYPRHPNTIKIKLSFDPAKHFILEAKINPATALVTNAEYYTEAGWALGDMGEDMARDWAQRYWGEAKTLDQYLQEGHDGSSKDYSDFSIPEVLIPEDIPPQRLKMGEPIIEKLSGR